MGEFLVRATPDFTRSDNACISVAQSQSDIGRPVSKQTLQDSTLGHTLESDIHVNADVFQ